MVLQLEQYQQFMLWLATKPGKRFLTNELTGFARFITPALGNQILIVGGKEFNINLATGFLQVNRAKLADLHKKLPYPDNCFDCIVLPHILEFVSEPELIMLEAQRLLRPEGLLLISVISSAKYAQLFSIKPLSPASVIKQLQAMELNEIKRYIFGSRGWQRYIPWFAEGYILAAKQREYGLTPLKFKAISKPILVPNVNLASQLRNHPHETN